MARKDSNKPRRPRNSWIIFRSKHCTEAAARSTAATAKEKQQEASTALGERWRNMSDEEKEPYFEAAAAEKVAHAIKWPHYQYHPESKEQKRQQKVQKKKERDGEKRKREEQKEMGRAARREEARAGAADMGETPQASSSSSMSPYVGYASPASSEASSSTHTLRYHPYIQQQLPQTQWSDSSYGYSNGYQQGAAPYQQMPYPPTAHPNYGQFASGAPSYPSPAWGYPAVQPDAPSDSSAPAYAPAPEFDDSGFSNEELDIDFPDIDPPALNLAAYNGEYPWDEWRAIIARTD
ncbi:hypothetical protein PLICRDRAFT_172723 [Plicaturopsis crispa FD-325 SS-3]|nr:hypothetical protein PLICRDRAFT_172723 [Plicaturopsis crispa FD-325 SS-3]